MNGGDRQGGKELDLAEVNRGPCVCVSIPVLVGGHGSGSNSALDGPMLVRSDDGQVAITMETSTKHFGGLADTFGQRVDSGELGQFQGDVARLQQATAASMRELIEENVQLEQLLYSLTFDF